MVRAFAAGANIPNRRRAAGEEWPQAFDAALEEGRQGMVGFDLTFGYPAGFAVRVASGDAGTAPGTILRPFAAVPRRIGQPSTSRGR